MDRYHRIPYSSPSNSEKKSDKNNEEEVESTIVEDKGYENIASIHKNALSRLFRIRKSTARNSDDLENTNHSGEGSNTNPDNSSASRTEITEKLRNKLHRLQRRKAYLLSELAMARQPAKTARVKKRNLTQNFYEDFMSRTKRRPYFHPYDDPRNGMISLRNNHQNVANNSNIKGTIVGNNCYSKKKVEGLASVWANLRTIRRLEAAHHLAGISARSSSTTTSDSSFISFQIDIGLFGRYVGQYHLNFHLVQLSFSNFHLSTPHNSGTNEKINNDNKKEKPLSFYFRLERHTMPISPSSIPFILQRNFGPHGMLKYDISDDDKNQTSTFKRMKKCIGDFYDASYAHAMRRDFCHFLEQWPATTLTSTLSSKNKIDYKSRKSDEFNSENNTYGIDWRRYIQNSSHPLHQVSFQNISYNDSYDRITFEFIGQERNIDSISSENCSRSNSIPKNNSGEGTRDHYEKGGNQVDVTTFATKKESSVKKRQYLIQLVYDDPMIAKVTSAQIKLHSSKDDSKITRKREEKQQLISPSSNRAISDKKKLRSLSNKGGKAENIESQKSHTVNNEKDQTSNIHAAINILIRYALPQALEKIIDILM